MTSGPAPADPHFATTRWSVVVAAGRPTTAVSREALEILCRTYWYPLYAYARRRGADRHAAQDLVQGFFAMILERGAVAAADPERGRFRTFLLTSFRNFAVDEHDRAAALKRGGGVPALSLDLDFDGGESRLAMEPSHGLTPEREFERRWALALLARALRRTRDAFEASTGRAELYAALVPFIGGEGDAAPYAEIAARLGTTEGAIKVAVHRLRAAHRENVRAEVRDTVGDGADVDAEIRDLLAALGTVRTC